MTEGVNCLRLCLDIIDILMGKKRRKAGWIDVKSKRRLILSFTVLDTNIFSAAKSAINEECTCKSRIIIVFTKSDQVINPQGKSQN